MTSQVRAQGASSISRFFCRRNKIRGVLPTLKTDISKTKKYLNSVNAILSLSLICINVCKI